MSYTKNEEGKGISIKVMCDKTVAINEFKDVIYEI